MLKKIIDAIKRDVEMEVESEDFVSNTLTTLYLLASISEQLETLTCQLAPTRPALQQRESALVNTGMMLAFMLDAETAQQLAIPCGEPPEQLHITLAYLGDTQDTPDDDLLRPHTSPESIQQILADIARDEQPLTGVIGGLGRFTPAETDEDPIIALVDVPGLAELRTKLVGAIKDAGYFVADNHGYTPHITLAYVDHDAPTPISSVPPLPLRLDAVTLAIADQYIPFKLEGSSHEDAESTQSAEAEHDQFAGTNQSKSPASLSEIHEDGEDDAGTNPQDDTDPDRNKQELAAALIAIFLAMQSRASGGISRAAIPIIYSLTDDDKLRMTQLIAGAYLASQGWAYNQVKQTTDLDLPGVASTLSDAMGWAREQVVSIVQTLHELVSNLVSNLPHDLAPDQLAQQMKDWLSNYADYKVPQIVNVAWSSGADLGTNAALTDVLDKATDPTQTVSISTDNIRVRVVPEESSSDHCSQYAGNDYAIDEYFALQIHWPFHPGCPHHIEAYIADASGADSGDDTEIEDEEL